jgi:glycosyltransferase involved in cell wall biosynthesis
MRIGIDITALPANPVGAGTYTIELVRALIELGPQHQWVIFAQPNGKELLAMPSHPAVQWVIVAEKTPFLRLLWEQTVFPFLVKRARINVLHSLHYTRPIFLPCASVVTFHDMTFFLFPELHTFFKRIFFPAAIRLSARLANALIAVSESTRKDAIRLLNIPEHKIHTAPNGVSSVFRPIPDQESRQICKNKYNLPDRFILFVGTIEPRKNLPVLLKAYQHLVKNSPTPQQRPVPPLVIAGKMGWMYNEVLQQINHLELEEKVILTGYISSRDLPIVYNLAEVFVYPSIYEGFGLPTLEAMACGTPVITTNVSAMADYVGEAGILVPAHDDWALANAIQSVLEDEGLQMSLSQKGRSQAALFTWQQAAQITLKVYELAAGTANAVGICRMI